MRAAIAVLALAAARAALADAAVGALPTSGAPRFLAGNREFPDEVEWTHPRGVAIARARRQLAIYLPYDGNASGLDAAGEIELVSLDDLRVAGAIRLRLAWRDGEGEESARRRAHARWAAVNRRLAAAGFAAPERWRQTRTDDGFDVALRGERIVVSWTFRHGHDGGCSVRVRRLRR